MGEVEEKMLRITRSLVDAIDEIQEEKIKSNFYVDCSRQDFINIINKQTRTIIKVKELLHDLKEHAKHIERNREKLNKSDAIIHHWKVFNEHLEENPSLKEEWDAFCMAIKLTED